MFSGIFTKSCEVNLEREKKNCGREKKANEKSNIKKQTRGEEWGEEREHMKEERKYKREKDLRWGLRGKEKIVNNLEYLILVNLIFWFN